MKKVLAVFLVCALLLAGCGKSNTPEPAAAPVSAPLTTARTVYFTRYGTLEGKHVAYGRLVETKNGEFVDTMQEDVYIFADNVVLESFDLRRTPSPSGNSIEKMTFDQFKEASLLHSNTSPVVYHIEVADGVIYSARSELKFIPAKAEETAPTETTAPASVSVQCKDCKLWFENEEAYGNHHCQGVTGITCYGCGLYFATTSDYDTHHCSANLDTVQCPDCGNWYQEGNEYRNHICAGLTATYHCGNCGLAFVGYENYANHHCQGVTGITCQGCGIYFATTRDYDSHRCSANLDLVECPVCGGWYTEGNEFRNHICVGTPDDYPCGACGLVFPSFEAYSNHHCQGEVGRICYGCGLYFASVYEYDTHHCTGNAQGEDMVQCEYCGMWLETGNSYRAHMMSCHTAD